MSHSSIPVTSQKLELRKVERRAVRRSEADIAVQVVASDGVFAAAMRDLSIHGCSLSYSKPAAARLGQIVKIEHAETVPVAGIVRWVRENHVGVEFLRPLPSGHGLFAGVTPA